MSCFEVQKQVFLNFKNSFLEAVARNENSLTHCKKQRKSMFLRLTSSLKNTCFWVSKTDVFKSQKSLKKIHFLALVSLFLATCYRSTKSETSLKHRKTYVKQAFVSLKNSLTNSCFLASKTTLFGFQNSLKTTLFYFFL